MVKIQIHLQVKLLIILKELLTPKFFKVKNGFTSEDEYKLYSVRKKFKKEIKPLIPFDDIVINEPDELVPIRPNGEFDDIGRFEPSWIQ